MCCRAHSVNLLPAVFTIFVSTLKVSYLVSISQTMENKVRSKCLTDVEACCWKSVLKSLQNRRSSSLSHLCQFKEGEEKDIHIHVFIRVGSPHTKNHCVLVSYQSTRYISIEIRSSSMDPAVMRLQQPGTDKTASSCLFASHFFSYTSLNVWQQ